MHKNNFKIATKKCHSCHENILKNALKCKYCNSYQDWRGSLQFSHSILALLVALVSVLSLSAPMLKALLTPDDSDLQLTYIEGADTGIKVIASNLGARPAFLNISGGLKIFFENRDGELAEHVLFLSAAHKSREDLFIPENSSKLFLFSVDFQQPIEGAFEIFYEEFDHLFKLKKCTFHISHRSFRGKEKQQEILLFQSSDKINIHENLTTPESFNEIVSALECLGKIPEPIRKQFERSHNKK